MNRICLSPLLILALLLHSYSDQLSANYYDSYEEDTFYDNEYAPQIQKYDSGGDQDYETNSNDDYGSVYEAVGSSESIGMSYIL